MADNRELWEGLNSESMHHIKYPVESVIRFVKKNCSGASRVLDDGCGAGRHVIFLAEEGYEPYGIDITESGVEYTKKRLRDIGYGKFENNIFVSGSEQLPFEDEYFDCVISYGVLYYLRKEKIKEAIDEIYRVLKQGAFCLLQIRTIDDYRFDRKTIVDDDEHGCYINESDSGKSAKKESGMFMHFFDKEEIKELCKSFKKIAINTKISNHENDSYADVNYLVELQK